MDFPHQGTIPPYLSDEVVNNNIGAAGCSYLSQADLRDLEAIDLCTIVKKQTTTRWGLILQIPQQSRMGEAQSNSTGYICGYVASNEVGGKGCRHLSKAVWGQLEEISLSHSCLTQGITKSGTGAAGTSVREAGGG